MPALLGGHAQPQLQGAIVPAADGARRQRGAGPPLVPVNDATSAQVQDLATQVAQLTQVVRDMMTEMGNLQAKVIEQATARWEAAQATQVAPTSPAVWPLPQRQANPGTPGARRSLTVVPRREARRGRQESSEGSPDNTVRDRSRDRVKPGIV